MKHPLARDTPPAMMVCQFLDELPEPERKADAALILYAAIVAHELPGDDGRDAMILELIRRYAEKVKSHDSRGAGR